MIPKRIHYCWLGGSEPPPLAMACMETWRKHNPEFEIKKWDESNFSSDSTFFKKAISDKKWAFASDFMRLQILHDHGGIYLDVDMEVVQPLAPLLEHEAFLGYESKSMINGGIIGSIAGQDFLKMALRRYESAQLLSTYTPIPQIISELLGGPEASSVSVYSPEYFYPYNPYSEDPLRAFPLQKFVTPNTFTVHHWQGSWLELDAEIRHIYVQPQTPMLTKTLLKLARLAARFGM